MEERIILLHVSKLLCSCLSSLQNFPHSQVTKQGTMLVLLAAIFVVHIATCVMLFVSTIANVSCVLLLRNLLNIYRRSHQRCLSHTPYPVRTSGLALGKHTLTHALTSDYQIMR